MNVFWREEPLDEQEIELFKTVNVAHHNSALRRNASSDAVQMSCQGSGDYTKAMAAALMTMGNLHAPILQTYDLFSSDYPSTVEKLLQEGRLVPGWGNSLVKGQPDPIWQDVADLIRDNWESEHKAIQTCQQIIDDYGLTLFPNPSCYTAIVAHILEMPREISPYLLVVGRLQAWTQLAMHELCPSSRS